MSRGRHRRPRTFLIPRQLSRLPVVFTAGGAGVVASLVAATGAHAAPVSVAASAPAKAESRSEGKPAAEAGAGQRPDAGSHTVASGDTLSGIAADRGVEGGWKALYEANRKTVGDDPDLILPGQKLTLARATTLPGGEQGRGAKPLAAQPAADTSPAQSAAPKSYPDNLDGWIREALDIMRANGIPGTYEGIHRNIMRESSGNPNAVNNWDINAQRGTPSIGLLQIIKPTFDAYRVPGTANSQYDPVANIVAACNYAADRYGSIDNVYSAY
ncbi:MAG TPA: LysM peptidoglycan-binding domain-containing protein [Streptomyces sp.]|nr:LysM peptidoglycan-binding domain-containing protein [Streptomyces sp.]